MAREHPECAGLGLFLDRQSDGLVVPAPTLGKAVSRAPAFNSISSSALNFRCSATVESDPFCADIKESVSRIPNTIAILAIDTSTLPPVSLRVV